MESGSKGLAIESQTWLRMVFKKDADDLARKLFSDRLVRDPSNFEIVYSTGFGTEVFSFIGVDEHKKLTRGQVTAEESLDDFAGQMMNNQQKQPKADLGGKSASHSGGERANGSNANPSPGSSHGGPRRGSSETIGNTNSSPPPSRPKRGKKASTNQRSKAEQLAHRQSQRYNKGTYEFTIICELHILTNHTSKSEMIRLRRKALPRTLFLNRDIYKLAPRYVVSLAVE